MGEIKFRAWDENLKKMFVVANIDFRYPKPLVLNNDEPNFVNKITGQFPLMQYTGLHDKNGKEIYEGDVLLIPDEDVVPVTDEGQGPTEPCDHIVAVEYREGEFGFEIPKTDDGETGWFSWRTWNEIDDPAKIEIIGNIYENPELLKP